MRAVVQGESVIEDAAVIGDLLHLRRMQSAESKAWIDPSRGLGRLLRSTAPLLRCGCAVVAWARVVMDAHVLPFWPTASSSLLLVCVCVCVCVCVWLFP